MYRRIDPWRKKRKKQDFFSNDHTKKRKPPRAHCSARLVLLFVFFLIPGCIVGILLLYSLVVVLVIVIFSLPFCILSSWMCVLVVYYTNFFCPLNRNCFRRRLVGCMHSRQAQSSPGGSCQGVETFLMYKLW